ncbi:hypothetical protein LIER_25163 [Lithospermum erythrorhizon]|uniref:Uncharacterized protein n=1 Tax=Lithospermum erythrorhizon TaxID=34254 RepID=A0AAV3R6X0_LITER
MAPRNNVTILESFQIAPSLGAVPELSIPLTCSDMFWFGFSLIHQITFYKHPVSRTCFNETIIPGLKNSLSLALKHFPSVAGNLVIPSNSIEPIIKYLDGNSVPFTIAETNSPGFEWFVGNQPRNCIEFYQLIPQLPKSSESGGLKMYPLIAFQVTMFPGEGFCIGITHNHVLGDDTSMYSFIKAWSTICKDGEYEATKRNELSPIYDREVMKVYTKELDDVFWRNFRNTKLKEANMDGHFISLAEDTDKERTTFVISMEDIQKLKKHVSDKQTSIKHLSSFTVVCAYVWTCLLKSGNARMNNVYEDEQEYITFAVDCRGRPDPVIPRNYFGNCLVGCRISAKTRQLCGDEGLFIATELIGDSIQQRVSYNGLLEGFKLLCNKAKVKEAIKLFSVAGSPRQNYYNMDFGWGKPRKIEITSIDSTGAMSLSGCRDDSEGLEIGLALTKKIMESFTDIFSKGLECL